MSDSDDWGCVLFIGVVAAAGWYAWNNYEIRKRDPDATETTTPVNRPTGEIYVTELKDGTVWRLDADSVRGAREARQAWQISDFSKNKKVTSQSVKTLFRINCSTSAYRTLSVVEYDKNDKVIDHWDQKSFGEVDNYPPPKSVIETFIDLACSRVFDADAVPAVGPKPPVINVSNVQPT